MLEMELTFSMLMVRGHLVFIDIETTSDVSVPGMYMFQLGSAPPGGVDEFKRSCVASDKELDHAEVWLTIM